MASKPDRVSIFFYGTFMNQAVLAEDGIEGEAVVPAKLSGFRLTIRPRVNLKRDERACVYGSIAAVSPGQIAKSYNQLEERFGVKYFPQAVVTEALDGSLWPALCYIAPIMTDGAPQTGYVRQLAECVRELGHPEGYASYIESHCGDQPAD